MVAAARTTPSGPGSAWPVPPRWPRRRRPRREERKVVSVLFCDLVGFTSRAEQLDPEDVRGLLRPYYDRLRRELERFGGTVEKFIGDAVMALFGAPVAHEDDPERAVRAALAIREAIAELNEADPGAGPARAGRGDHRRGAGRPRRPPGRAGRGSPRGTWSTPRPGCRRPPRWTGSWSTRRPGGRPAGRSTTGRAEPVEAKGKAEPVPVWLAAGAAGQPRGRRRPGARDGRWSAASGSWRCCGPRWPGPAASSGRSWSPWSGCRASARAGWSGSCCRRSRPSRSWSPGGRAAACPTARAWPCGRWGRSSRPRPASWTSDPADARRRPSWPGRSPT